MSAVYSIDLMQALAKKPFFKERPRRVGLWGTLIVSNLFWISFVAVMGTIVWSACELGSMATRNYIEARERVAALEAEKARIEAERDLKIARLSAFESSSPAEIVTMAKNIHEVFNTASGSKQQRFFEEAIPEAIRLQVSEGIPASAVLAQAIYESHYGDSQLAKTYHNYFGLKATSDWQGKRAVSMPTKDSGVQTTADFRSYDNVKEGFSGYAEFLKRSGRYDRAFHMASGVDFVREVLRAGYCPDADYLRNIQQIIERHNLQKLDAIQPTATAVAEQLNKPTS